MKSKLIHLILSSLIFLPIFSNTSFAQIDFHVIIEDSLDLRPLKTVESNSNNYFLAAARIPNHANQPSSTGIYKLDSNGITLDTIILEHPIKQVIIQDLITTSTGVICIGHIWDATLNESSLYFLNLDENLNILSEQRTLLPNTSEIILLKAKLNDNNTIAVMGGMEELDLPSIPFALNLDINGSILSSKLDLGFTDFIGDFIPVHNGFLTYCFSKIRLLDSQFNVLTTQPAPYELSAQGNILHFRDSMFLICGKKYFLTGGNRDIGVGFFNSQLNTLGVHYYGGLNDTIDFPAFTHSIDFIDRNVIYTGGTKNIQLGSAATAIVQSSFILNALDSNLNKRFEYCFNLPNKYLNAYGLLADTDGGALMYGTSFDFSTSPSSLFLNIILLKTGITYPTNSTTIENTNGISIFPNPTTNYLTIKFDYFTPKNTEIEIFDMVGRRVHTQLMQQQNEQISLSNFVNGIYVVRVRSGAQTWTRKVVKQ